MESFKRSELNRGGGRSCPVDVTPAEASFMVHEVWFGRSALNPTLDAFAATGIRFTLAKWDPKKPSSAENLILVTAAELAAVANFVLGESDWATVNRRGWALYLLDKVGVISFGRYWPVAGWRVRSGFAVDVVVEGEGCEKGAPHRWTPSTSNGKYEEEELEDVHMTWSFASLKERSGCSLIGPTALESIDMDCG
ncbi:hypothetical protein AK812_SmicGene3776 [Symbiodinium microadriaticum]|uniref:Uncharacterized protein n=1 Tax=Symbiodinium microadriaticum TaxID=2951 RepID=A0A1Q9EY03_SYMMI|nr:hypothetical protein AK812_SmicGene3776 [Symbiodinium microadriaticum]